MKYKESEKLELKKSTAELKEAVISVGSILNKRHKGQIFFGVKNDGTVVGQTISEQTLREVSRAISEHIEPRIYPRVEKVRLNGKDCVKVIFSGSDIPYLARGRGYIRVGDEDRQLSARELERMFLNRNRNAFPWESDFSDRKILEVHQPTVRAFVKRGNEAGRIAYKFTNVKDTLKKLDLMKSGRLLKAAEALFCSRNPLEVQAAVFAGTDKLTFLDISQFQGNLFTLLEKSETYVKEHMNWRVEFGALERKEIPEIPVKALREALVNSLCHRDYRIPRSNSVAVFKNRVEIYNPGAFPEGYKPEDFIKGEEGSMSPNPLIAGTLFKSKDIEKWGSGLKRIAKECAENSVKVEFKILKSGFLVIFHRSPAEEATPQKTPQRTPQKILTGLESKILAAIAKNPSASRQKLGRTLRISPDTIKEYLDKLKKKGAIRRVGPDKGGHWQVAQ